MNLVYTLICVTLILGGCASSGDTIIPPPVEESSVGGYQIGVGDVLRVNVWKSPELSSQVVVRPDGMISVPLLGDILSAGVAPRVLADQLVQGFAKYVRNPQVTVVVEDPASSGYLRRVRVTGAVNQQLSLPYRQGLSVLDLVLESGGLTPFAKGAAAQLYRKHNGEVKVYPVNLHELMLDGRIEQNFNLAPGDVLTVPERSF